MKKLLLTLLLSTFALCFLGCADEQTLDPRISQLRADLYFGETQDYEVTAYLETREDPLEIDGVCGKVENYLIFKIDFGQSQTSFENCEVSFTLQEKDYTASFEYKPLTSFLFARVKVDELPSDPFAICLRGDGLNQTVNLCSIKNADTVSFSQAINNLAQNNQACKEFLESDKGEIRIRLIDNDGYDYWYIGFFTEQKNISFLIDGQTCEIIAQKDGV